MKPTATMEQKITFPITTEFWDFIETNVPRYHERADVLPQAELQNFIDGHESQVQGITRDEALLLRDRILHVLFTEAVAAFTSRSLPAVPGEVCQRKFLDIRQETESGNWDRLPIIFE